MDAPSAKSKRRSQETARKYKKQKSATSNTYDLKDIDNGERRSQPSPEPSASATPDEPREILFPLPGLRECDKSAPMEADIGMEMRTIQGTSWKIVSESLKDITIDCNIEFWPGGIRMTTMDSAHISLCSLRIDGNKLDRYYCEKSYVIGVNTSNFHKLLKGTSASDSLTMRINKNDMDRLQIIIENEDRQSRTVASMKLLDIDAEQIQVPDKDFDICVSMLSSDLSRMAREMAMISDELRIRSNKENMGLVLTAEGDIGEVNQFIGTSDMSMDMTHESNTDIDGKFSLKYLVMFTKCNSLCNCVKMYLQPSYPLMLKYEIGNCGELVFALAPKVEDD